MSLTVHTARINYRGYDRLDVTRKSGKEGIFLAPSWSIIGPVIRARQTLSNRRLEERELFEIVERDGVEASTAMQALAFQISEIEREVEEAWDRYVPKFLEEMRASYRARRAEWDALLARERVTLCCFCNDPQRCHRTLLARDILPKLGATYAGEL